MAVVTAVSGAAIPGGDDWLGELDSAASNLVVIGTNLRQGGRDDQDPEIRTEFVGSFAISGDDISGIVTAIRQFRDGVLVYTIDSLQVDAAPLFDAILETRNGDAAGALVLSGNDTFTGSDGNDVLDGFAGDDIINAGGGDDTITGMTGLDTIDGGPGSDTVRYSGSQEQYTLGIGNEDGYRLFGNDFLYTFENELDGSDLLNNVEFLDFDENVYGGPFELARFDGLLRVSAEDQKSFIELYIAYFNRAPDAVGLSFWGTAFANGTSLEQMATLFIDQDETRAAYPLDTTDQAFVTTVFGNVLGRTPDAAGVDFWVGVLANGSVTRDQFILEVLRGARAELKPEEGQAFVDQQLADRAYLENKVSLGALYALEFGMSNVANAAATMSIFDGTEAGFDAAVSATRAFLFEAPSSEFRLVVNGELETTRFPDFVVPDVFTVAGNQANKPAMAQDPLSDESGAEIGLTGGSLNLTGDDYGL